MDLELYRYKAFIKKVYDGDTVTANVELGFDMLFSSQKIRLWGINAPEVRGPEKVDGKKSRDYLRELILNKEVILETIKDKKGKYGRYLGKIWFQDDTDWVCANDKLVEDGYAEYKTY